MPAAFCRSLYLALAAALAGATLTPPAAGQNPQPSGPLPGPFYVGAAVGVQFFDDNEDGDVDVDFDTGFAVAAQFGYRLGAVRAEAEIAYQEADTEASNGVETESDVLRYTISAFYDVDVPQPIAETEITPYLGAGLGLAVVDVSGDIDDDDNGFTWHGELGAAIELTPALALVPSYRFESIDTDAGGVDDAQTSHALRLGARYAF